MVFYNYYLHHLFHLSQILSWFIRWIIIIPVIISLFVILLLVSCTNNTKNKEVVVVEPVAKTLTLEFASKNPETTKNKEGTHVGVNEMLHLILADNNQTECRE